MYTMVATARTGSNIILSWRMGPTKKVVLQGEERQGWGDLPPRADSHHRGGMASRVGS
jgi:hypothetical protein